MKNFKLPPYPYDLLNPHREIAEAHEGGVIDLSVGTPCDPPPSAVIAKLSASNSEKGYPKSIGSEEYLDSCRGWLERRLNVKPEYTEAIAGCIGTKEFVASVPNDLRLKYPEKDTVLYPSISYPSYAMGATLAGCRAVPVPVDNQLRLDLTKVDEEDISRALLLWVNSPSNPTGVLENVQSLVHWGRYHDVPIFSDECYVEFTWGKPPSTILDHGTEGVIAVHSLSKRSNLAGLRAGFYAGDPNIVHWLSEVRKHAGKMIPGPVQAGSVLAWGDDVHVDEQRVIYENRLETLLDLFQRLGYTVSKPEGAFYLWAKSDEFDCWTIVNDLAKEFGVLVTPGDFFGDRSRQNVRIAAVQPDPVISLLQERIHARL
tara:strand:+ start:1317 stop:2432 length:1116 start_codon:yes stop_codon:yes gene_type:complete